MPVVVFAHHDFRHAPVEESVRILDEVDLTSRAHRLYRRAVWLTAMLPLAGLAVALDPAYRTWRFGLWVTCLVVILALMALYWQPVE